MFTCLLLLRRRVRDRRRERPPGGSGAASPSARRAHYVGDDVDLKAIFQLNTFLHIRFLWEIARFSKVFFLPALGIRWLSSSRPRCCLASEGSGAAEKREDDETKTIYFPPKISKKSILLYLQSCRAGRDDLRCVCQGAGSL